MTATTLPTGDVAAPDDGIAGAYTRHWLRAGVQIGYSAGLPIPPDRRLRDACSRSRSGKCCLWRAESRFAL